MFAVLRRVLAVCHHLVGPLSLRLFLVQQDRTGQEQVGHRPQRSLYSSGRRHNVTWTFWSQPQHQQQGIFEVIRVGYMFSNLVHMLRAYRTLRG